MAKIRLDVALVEGGFAESREKAKALIMAGIVYVNNLLYFYFFLCFFYFLIIVF